MGKFSVKKIFLKTMMVSSKNDANNNKVSRGQMILEKMERLGKTSYHIPSVFSSVSAETSQTHVSRVSGNLSGLFICCVGEQDFWEAGM